ncbi:MAG TPA: TonB-dependent receptor [Chroococcales cyanobacterium]
MLPILLFALPAFAEDKLPVDLPDVVVTGKGATPVWGTGGEKINLRPELRPEINMPFPTVKRATAEMVALTSVEATPSIRANPEKLFLPGNDRAEFWLGAGNGLDAGGYFARRSGDLFGLLKTEARLTPGWSDLSLDGTLDLAGKPLMARFLSQSEQSDNRTLGEMKGAWTQDKMRADAFVSSGKVLSENLWEFGGSWGWKPELSSPDHRPSLRAEIGRQGTSTRTDLLASLAGGDTWQLSPDWSLAASLETGNQKNQFFFDPKIGAEWRPSESASLALSLGSQIFSPSFEELYLSRQRVRANPDLLPERRPLVLELAGGTLLDKEVYFNGLLRYSKSNGSILPQLSGNYWLPQNLADCQDRFEGQGVLQFVGLEQSDKISYRIATLNPVGEASQQVGASRQGQWEGFQYEAGTALRWQQLGSFQTGSGQQAGWQWLVNCQVARSLDPTWLVYLSGSDLPIFSKQPANNYFTPLSLLAIGVKAVY